MNENAQAPEKSPQRANLGKSATPEEIRALNLLLLKKQVAQENVNSAKFPEGTTPTIISSFYKAAMEVFSEAKFEEDEWWKTVIIKHGFQGIKVYIDTGTGEFYTLMDVAPPPPAPPMPE